MKKLLAVMLVACMAFSLSSCSSSKVANLPPANGDYMFEAPKAGDKIAVMKTNYGEIKIKFFPEYAPKAVENFTTHAQNGYYNGLTFHRVMNDFMIQGGDPEGTGIGGESIYGAPFEDEFAPEVRNVRGAVSMANSGANTNGSQFFIVQNKTLTDEDKQKFEDASKNQDKVIQTLDDGTEIVMNMFYPSKICDYYLQNGGTPWLDYRHTVFGMVTEGMDIVDNIAAVEVDENAKPLEPVIIESITIETVS